MTNIKERITQLGRRHVAKLLGLIDSEFKGQDLDNFKKGVKAEMWNLVNDISSLLEGTDEYYNRTEVKEVVNDIKKPKDRRRGTFWT